MNCRIASRVVVFAAIFLSALGAARAQGAYPDRPISLIMPFAAGGPTDLVGRLVAEAMSDVLGQPVVVNNRPGAGGTIASAYVARAVPDGYTLLYSSASTHGIAPAMYRNLPYDIVKSFTPIGRVGASKSLIEVNANSNFKTLQDLIKHARENPNKLNYGSAGVGTPSHLGTMRFNAITGIQATHVPYKSGGEALAALMGGQIDYLQDAFVTSLPMIQSGKTRALAVSSEQRDPSLPDVPTYAELGFGKGAMDSWTGIVAPAGTPAPVVASLNEALRKALQSKSIKESFAKNAITAIGDSPAQFAAFIPDEMKKWKELADSAGLKGE